MGETALTSAGACTVPLEAQQQRHCVHLRLLFQVLFAQNTDIARKERRSFILAEKESSTHTKGGRRKLIAEVASLVIIARLTRRALLLSGNATLATIVKKARRHLPRILRQRELTRLRAARLQSSVVPERGLARKNQPAASYVQQATIVTKQ